MHARTRGNPAHSAHAACTTDRGIAPHADARVNACKCECLPACPCYRHAHSPSTRTLTAHARPHAAFDAGRVPAPCTLHVHARPIACTARVPAAGPRCTLACACRSTCTHPRRISLELKVREHAPCVHAPGARRRRRTCMHAPAAQRRPGHPQQRGAHGTDCNRLQRRPPPPQRLPTGLMPHC